MNLAQVWKNMVGGEICNGPDCGFDDLIQLAEVVMNNLIVVAITCATIAFVWIGFTLLTSGGDPSAKTKAKDMAWKVVWGLVFVLAGWLIVYTISNVLLSDGFTLLKRS